MVLLLHSFQIKECGYIILSDYKQYTLHTKFGEGSETNKQPNKLVSSLIAFKLV